MDRRLTYSVQLVRTRLLTEYHDRIAMTKISQAPSLFLASLLATLVLVCTSSIGQENSTDEQTAFIESITVTATKQDTELGATPIAISAFEYSNAPSGKLNRLSDVAEQTPNLWLGNSGNSGFPVIYLRGVGSTDTSMAADPSVGFYLDDVYVGRSAGVITDLHDVERVEVIKGPQGAMWGRNTMGGAVHVISNSPDSIQKNALSIGLGNYSNLNARGLFARRFNEHWSGKVSFSWRDRDGFSENLITGSDIGDANIYSLRTGAVYEVSDTSTWSFAADLTEDRSSSAAFDPLLTGAPILRGLAGPITVSSFPFNHFEPEDEFEVNHRLDSREYRDIAGASAKYLFDGENFRFQSISAIRNLDFDNIENTDGLSVQLIEIFQRTKQSQVSQEFRLFSDSKSLQWMIGAFYLVEETDDVLRVGSQDFNLVLESVFGPQDYSSINNSTIRAKNAALFGSVSVPLLDSLKVDLAFRYSKESKQFDFFREAFDNGVLLDPSIPDYQDNANWSQLSPSLTVSYLPTEGDDSLLYASISKGFRSGGYNSLQTTMDDPFAPESLIAYQAGYKLGLLDDRIKLDLAAFYYDHNDMQVQTTLAGNGGSPKTLTTNAAEATEQGLELNIKAMVTKNASFDFSVSYLDAIYDEFVNADGVDVSGNRIQYSSKTSAVFGLEYLTNLTEAVVSTYRMEYSFHSKIYFTELNQSQLMQPDFSLVNLYAEFQSGDLPMKATFYGKNIFDQVVIGSAVDFIDVLGTATRVYREPRTFGVNLQYEF